MTTAILDDYESMTLAELEAHTLAELEIGLGPPSVFVLFLKV